MRMEDCSMKQVILCVSMKPHLRIEGMLAMMKDVVSQQTHLRRNQEALFSTHEPRSHSQKQERATHTHRLTRSHTRNLPKVATHTAHSVLFFHAARYSIPSFSGTRLPPHFFFQAGGQRGTARRLPPYTATFQAMLGGENQKDYLLAAHSSQLTARTSFIALFHG